MKENRKSRAEQFEQIKKLPPWRRKNGESPSEQSGGHLLLLMERWSGIK